MFTEKLPNTLLFKPTEPISQRKIVGGLTTKLSTSDHQLPATEQAALKYDEPKHTALYNPDDDFDKLDSIHDEEYNNAKIKAINISQDAQFRKSNIEGGSYMEYEQRRIRHANSDGKARKPDSQQMTELSNSQVQLEFRDDPASDQAKDFIVVLEENVKSSVYDEDIGGVTEGDRLDSRDANIEIISSSRSNNREGHLINKKGAVGRHSTPEKQGEQHRESVTSSFLRQAACYEYKNGLRHPKSTKNHDLN